MGEHGKRKLVGGGVNRRLTGLTVALVVPSLGVVQKYTGNLGTGVYIAGVLLVLWMLESDLASTIIDNITSVQLGWLLGLTFLLMLAIFWVGYPLANSGALGGGSDRDEALNTATRALLDGRYPYSEQTYLGNPISPLPGALFLAAPFVLLGNSAYQNLFWLLTFVLVLAYLMKDARQALLLFWLILALSPVVLQEFITGGDLLANSIFVTLGVLALAYLAPVPAVPFWVKCLVAVLLGVGLSWRLNFGLVLPLLYSALALRTGMKTALIYLGLICITFAGVSLPLYLINPVGFTPISTIDELGRFGEALPFAGPIVTGSSVIFALLLSLRRSNADISSLMRNCAMVLALPVVCLVILNCLVANQLVLSLAGFGIAFLFFGAIGNRWRCERQFASGAQG